MELKAYQKRVLADLQRYLELLKETNSMSAAYQKLWNEKSVPVGDTGMHPYISIIPNAPVVCAKVPTGGGKTYIAANAIRPVFEQLPVGKAKAVVWLVPSEAILTQTVNALKDPNHPYRQAINADFGGKVEVYTKTELLAGQGLNISAVFDQLTLMVLSYDSFRGRKEALKSKQENSALAPLSRALGPSEDLPEGADDTALMTVISKLNPLVIVDESHHARSELSKEMLADFSPCFVFELTATPRKDSNIISFVDAGALKRAHMIKLPLIAYNRSSVSEAVSDAIDLRNRLEQQAKNIYEKEGRYIRPMVLFQAQPKVGADAESYEKLKNKLVKEGGIPEEQIAIKTADINELDGVDLNSPDCPIRYIITVNALKEGWDAPNSYILCSLANKSSRVDVEQIVGRILRQPYQKHFDSNPSLNMSYVITSSANFKEALDSIVEGLNYAGFSEKDCREGKYEPERKKTSAEEEQTAIDVSNPQNPVIELKGRDESEENEAKKTEEVFADFHITPPVPQPVSEKPEVTDAGSGMIKEAEQAQKEYERNLQNDAGGDTVIPDDIKGKISIYKMNYLYQNDAGSLEIPQFYRKVANSIFVEGYEVMLEKEHLSEGFTLKGKPYDINFASTMTDDVAKIDVESDADTPRVFKLSEKDQQYFKQQFSRFSPEQKVKACKDILHKALNSMDEVDGQDLRTYIDIIVDSFDRETLTALEKSPMAFAYRIREYIEKLLSKHRKALFDEWIDTGDIICKPFYMLPVEISPLHVEKKYGKSLYEAEEATNDFEDRFAYAFSGLDNVLWWHRNEARQPVGLRLNGFINHYPDYVVRTRSGKTILVECKGDYLDNDETRDKVELGQTWQNLAGPDFKYYLVFESKEIKIKGVFAFEDFLARLKML